VWFILAPLLMIKMTALDLVQAYYQAFNRRDWAGMLALLSEDVRHDINQGDAQIGLEAFEKFLAHMDECYSEQVQDLVLMGEASDTRIAAEFNINGVYKKTDGTLPVANGQTYLLPVGAFFQIQAGKISRVSTHYNLRDWIQMVQ
jgi:steroid delta-isomerase-like uncharacterized protein